MNKIQPNLENDSKNSRKKIGNPYECIDIWACIINVDCVVHQYEIDIVEEPIFNKRNWPRANCNQPTKLAVHYQGK